jgi:Ser/Thr protein kinase RdoA (MazF antagonist)
MTSPAKPGAGVAAVLLEYDLGELIAAEPLAGGSATVMKVRTGRGSFVLKQARRLADIELQARAAHYLAGRGIRQPRIVRTRAGTVVTADGHFLQEFLPGKIVRKPRPLQVAAAMRHIGTYHAALAGLAGSYASDASSLWTRVADPGYLVSELPGLLARYQLAGEPELASLRALDQARDALLSLPRQIAHGDIAPDNVLMDRDGVVSVIDFTPFCESALFGACAALYWYDIYETGATATSLASRLRRSMSALGEGRPWTGAELELWTTGLLREALRRLATPLALAARSGEPPAAAALRARHAALLAVLDVLTH